MHISASIRNTRQQHNMEVTTNGISKGVTIPSKTEGKGSSVNGGELLFLALATCFCNDIYREAAKRQIEVISVEVMVSGEFGGEGEPGFNIRYVPKVEANATAEEIRDLVTYVDNIAEVHNTLRRGAQVILQEPDNQSNEAVA